MSKGRFEKKNQHQRRFYRSKSLALMVACVMLISCVVGGTVAWLTAQDTPVVNKFSSSTIGVELKEHTYNEENDKLTTTVTDEGVSNYKMIPGWTIPKDPKAWITSGSEAAYLFVKIEESVYFDTFMTYAIAKGWTLLNSDSATKESEIVTDDSTADAYVIYREVAAGHSAANMEEEYAFDILLDNKITVRDTVTKELMSANLTQPTLTFTAYAHQLYRNENFEKFDVNEAWNNLNPNQ